MNRRLQRLKPYPFDRLRALLGAVEPNGALNPIPLHIGEPKHEPPQEIVAALHESIDTGLGAYPLVRGLEELRGAASGWLEWRYQLPKGRVGIEQVIPVNGTREALFSFCQAVVDNHDSNPVVMMPNPGYQIYEGAALLAGATPYYMNTVREEGFLPNFETVPDEIWNRCQLLFVCSPGNPTGTVMSTQQWGQLIELAEQHDFVIAADECYSELYDPNSGPPVGLLQVAETLGRKDFRRCVVFHSLSKRSNLPGLRSGFVAGDAGLLGSYLKYRSYHGCAVPNPVQQASALAWQDERHVEQNRQMYQKKFDDVLPILAEALTVYRPAGAFYVWADVHGDDEVFAQGLYEQQHVSVLPGQYMSRTTPAGNPGKGMIRISLVAQRQACVEAAERIRAYAGSQ